MLWFALLLVSLFRKEPSRGRKNGVYPQMLCRRAVIEPLQPGAFSRLISVQILRSPLASCEIGPDIFVTVEFWQVQYVPCIPDISKTFIMKALSDMNFPLSTAFIVSHKFGLCLADLSIGESGVLKSATPSESFLGWSFPSSVFCRARFVDRFGFFIVSQISWMFCGITFLAAVFSLTDESIFSIVQEVSVSEGADLGPIICACCVCVSGGLSSSNQKLADSVSQGAAEVIRGWDEILLLLSVYHL
ncbi:hypothetical protein STEG23_031999 [Scotinomys teguina]